jgi:hypothetical protein
MKNVPDELAQKFVDAAMDFAADISEPILPCDAQRSRLAKRDRLRNDFVDAFSAIKNFEVENDK